VKSPSAVIVRTGLPMRFTIAFVIVVAAPAQAQQVEPKRTVEFGATLEVRITCADGKTVPPGVELRAVAMEESDRPIDRASLADRLTRAASGARRREFQGANGDAIFDVLRPAGSLVVVASAAGLYAERAIAPDDAGPVALDLHADRSFEVRVVDERGRPAARVPVAIAAFDTWGGLPDVLLDRATRFPIVVATDARDGVARFEHAQEWIDPDRETDSIALLAIPHRDHEQIRITPTLLEQGSVELHAPSFGAVELRFPGVTGVAVRLRERPAPLDPEGEYEHLLAPGEWRRGEPLALRVVDGSARCDRVGIGCRLELEAKWKGLLTPFVADFAGPDRAGAIVTWDLDANDGSAVAQTAALTGRLVDSSRRPISSRLLQGRIVTWRGDAAEESPEDDDVEFDVKQTQQTFTLATDGAGRIALDLGSRVPSAGIRRWFEIHEAAGDEEAERRGTRGWIDASERLAPGAHDLGDLLLVGSDAKESIARTSDEGLIAECEALRAWPHEVAFKGPSLDRRLNEMARRGGARLASFFEFEIASRREAATRAHEADLAARKAAWQYAKAHGAENEDEELPPRPDDDEPFEFAVPLKWAALLRRAQRKPAPIRIEATAPEFEAITPDSPEVKVFFHDVDAGFDALSVPKLDAPSWRITVLDHDGHVVPEPEPDLWVGSKISMWEPDPTLQHDDYRIALVPMGRRLELARPGDYRVRVDYLIGDVACLSSGDLPVQIKPIPIHVTRRDYDAIVSDIRAIDATKPVALTNSPVRPQDEFDGDPKSPEDALVRRGRLALPALLDELQETTDDPRRRAWILGLLWNTHLATAINSEQIESAVGSFEWYDFWPTIVFRGDDHNSSGLIPGNRSDPSATPDPRVQRELAATWTELRAWFEFTVEK
jgi:hypothetical protein